MHEEIEKAIERVFNKLMTLSDEEYQKLFNEFIDTTINLDLDLWLYGNSFLKTDDNGTFERLDPLKVIIKDNKEII